jgi:hypothetical protein
MTHTQCAIKVIGSFIVVPLWAALGIVGLVIAIALFPLFAILLISGCVRPPEPISAFGEAWPELLNLWADWEPPTFARKAVPLGEETK